MTTNLEAVNRNLEQQTAERLSAERAIGMQERRRASRDQLLQALRILLDYVVGLAPF
jgi:hypothetical protein